MSASESIPEDSYDDRAALLGSRVHQINEVSSPEGSVNSLPAFVESNDVYKSRWRSIRVMYLVMFLGSVTFTITMSSLWPFLQVLNPSASTSFLGWVVAAYSLGQLVASPVFGGWANIRKCSREPLVISLIMTTLSNVFYMYLESLPVRRDVFMILARGLIGFSAGNVAVVRSYVSGATTVVERTGSMANLSIFQAMGFILGPVIQAALVPIGYPGPVSSVYFYFNMYTAPAFCAALVASISVGLLIFVFKEHRVYDKDIQGLIQSTSTSVEQQGSMPNFQYKLDYIAVCSNIFLFFIVLFMFTVFETIGTPLTMDMYAWTKTKATLYQGIILGAAGCLSIVVFMVVKILAKKYSERCLLLAGFIFCFCGYFVFIPWGDQLPPMGYIPLNQTVSSSNAIFSLAANVIKNGQETDLHHISVRDAPFNHDRSKFIHQFAISDFDYFNLNNSTSSLVSKISSAADVRFATENNEIATKLLDFGNLNSNISTSSPVNGSTTTIIAPNGCPSQFDWCSYVPVIYLAQFLGGTVLISIGYPVCQMLSYALYSKMLGPKPQGLWMGWLTAAGSLARTVGPIYVSQVYDSWGPQVTFGSCCGIIILTIIFYLIVFRRMVPFSFKPENLAQLGASGDSESR